MTEPQKVCINHRDRPVRAQNRCGSCYVLGRKHGTLPKVARYIDDLIEEVDAVGLTWDQAEEMFGRKRTTISNALYRRKEYDVLHSIQMNTYGVLGQPNIRSVLWENQTVTTFAPALIEEAEYHPDWTWADLCAKFEGKNRKSLYDALKRAKRDDLIARINKNSGVGKRSPYLEDIIRLTELDSDMTWASLCRLLHRREDTVRQYMLKKNQHDLVKRLDKASGKGRVKR